MQDTNRELYQIYVGHLYTVYGEYKTFSKRFQNENWAKLPATFVLQPSSFRQSYHGTRSVTGFAAVALEKSPQSYDKETGPFYHIAILWRPK